MPYDGSGNFVRSFPPGGWQGDASANIKIKSDRHDQHDNDLASGLSNAICKDGQSSPTADIPMNGKKIVNLGAPINPNDAATKAYADIPKPFSVPIQITGSYPQSAIQFTGAIGPWGISYVTPDLFTGTDDTPQWIWNDKADATGSTVMRLSESGSDLSLFHHNDDAPAAGPNLSLTRLRPHTTPGDVLGSLQFSALNSTAAVANYAYLLALSDVTTAGVESGSLRINVKVAGVATDRITVDASGVAMTGAVTNDGSSVLTGANIFTGGAHTTTDFPVMTTLLCMADINLTRQASYPVYLDGTGGGYIASNPPSGVSVTAACTGTWISRGSIPVAVPGAMALVLMQRVA